MYFLKNARTLPFKRAKSHTTNMSQGASVPANDQLRCSPVRLGCHSAMVTSALLLSRSWDRRLMSCGATSGSTRVWLLLHSCSAVRDSCCSLLLFLLLTCCLCLSLCFLLGGVLTGSRFLGGTGGPTMIFLNNE